MENGTNAKSGPAVLGHHVRLAWYPFSSILIAIWIAYIAALTLVLERATDPHKLSYPEPWWDKRLPAAMLTGFAQAHVPITAMHFARLAVSALHRKSTAPRSWAELFWTADRAWQGPVGLASTYREMRALGRVPSLSATFALFSLVSTVSLPTPYILSRAWEEGVVQIPSPANITTTTFVQSTLSDLTGWMQMSAGEGGWSSALPISDTFKGFTFVPTGRRLNDSDAFNDTFVAGTFEGAAAKQTLGVRTQSTCSPVNVDLQPDTSTPITWTKWCQNILPEGQSYNLSTLALHTADVVATVGFCLTYNHLNLTWLNTTEPKAVTAYVWFNGTNNHDPTVTGVVRCDSTFAMGHADVDGRNGTFTPWSFSLTPFTGKTYVKHPLYLALYDLRVPFNDSIDSQHIVAEMRMQTALALHGYLPDHSNTKAGVQYFQPSLQAFANQLNRGALSMGAAIGAIARMPNQQVSNAVKFHSVSARVRNWPYIWGAVGLLGVWLLLVVYCTARMLRPTFASTLGSYSTGRLLASEPGLVEAHPVGELAENPNITRRFTRIGQPITGTLDPLTPSRTSALGLDNRSRSHRAGYDRLC